jgi:hypothetical protein
MPRPPDCVINSGFFCKLEFLASEILPLWCEQDAATTQIQHQVEIEMTGAYVAASLVNSGLLST